MAPIKKRIWIAVFLSCVLWGSGHYYLEYKKLGIMLTVLEILYLLAFHPSWISIGAFIFCTVVICYDTYKKAVGTFEALSPKSKKEKEKITPATSLKWGAIRQKLPQIRLNYKTIIAIGLVIFISNFLFADPIIGTILIIVGIIIIVKGLRMRAELLESTLKKKKCRRERKENNPES